MYNLIRAMHTQSYHQIYNTQHAHYSISQSAQNWALVHEPNGLSRNRRSDREHVEMGKYIPMGVIGEMSSRRVAGYAGCTVSENTEGDWF